ncbi:hypothetical protein K440DRAFT_639983 [Wilcoxina mikolae CBS 423.85]|nr:hypothetical protein K440DRAFT_639983 [Wilcoxina mikolae CBS 423.85]
MSPPTSFPLPSPSLMGNSSTLHSPMSMPSPSAAPTTTPPLSTRKACDSCRLSKARCEPLTSTDIAALGSGSDANNICQRCAKTGRRCVFGERSRRRKRRKTDSGDDGDGNGGTDRDKVSRLEKKLSILEARLETTTKMPSEDRRREEEGDESTPGPDYGYFKPPNTASIPASASPSATIPRPKSTSPGCAGPLLLFNTERPKSTRPKPKSTLEPDVINRDILTLSNATALYSHFVNIMLPHFPFFVHTDSFAHTRHHKPVLFLAILSAASACTSAVDLRSKLLDEVYVALARAVFPGDKSLELVQAIIITGTWYHAPATVGQSRVWMLTMQATAIAIDLKFASSADLDERRAMVSCYAQNTLVAIVLRRPVLLRYGRKIQESLDLVEATGIDGDQILSAYVTLVRYMEEAYEGCGAIEGDYNLAPSTQVVSWVLEAFSQRTAEHRKRIAKTIKSTAARASAEIARLGVAVQVFTIVFDIPGGMMGAQAKLLQAIHEIIEAFLNLSAEDLRSSPFLVFGRTANACSVLLRLASVLAGERGSSSSSTIAPELRADGRLEQLKVTHYLTALIDRLRTLLGPPSSTSGEGGGGTRTMATTLALIEGLRVYYNKHLAPAPPPPPAPPLPPHQEEGEALAAASILCGTPTAYPQYNLQHIQQQQQQQQPPFSVAEMDLSPEEIESFFYGVEGQFMANAIGGAGVGGVAGIVGWPAGSWGAEGVGIGGTGEFGWTGA